MPGMGVIGIPLLPHHGIPYVGKGNTPPAGDQGKAGPTGGTERPFPSSKKESIGESSATGRSKPAARSCIGELGPDSSEPSVDASRCLEI